MLGNRIATTDAHGNQLLEEREEGRVNGSVQIKVMV